MIQMDNCSLHFLTESRSAPSPPPQVFSSHHSYWSLQIVLIVPDKTLMINNGTVERAGPKWHVRE